MAIGDGKLGSLPAQNSILGIILAKAGNHCQAFHLLPNANVTTNPGHSKDFKEAHRNSSMAETRCSAESQATQVI